MVLSQGLSVTLSFMDNWKVMNIFVIDYLNDLGFRDGAHILSISSRPRPGYFFRWSENQRKIFLEKLKT